MVECGQKENQLEGKEQLSTWELDINRFLSKEGNRARLLFIRTESHRFNYTLRFTFLASNNKAKYKAMIQGVELVLEIGVEKLVAYSNS